MPLILLLILVLIILGPQWWVKWIINHHQKDLDRIPGTGGELAVHLLKQLKITDVEVESTDQGDHYDPTAMKVRLSEANYSGRSLAAVAIAAHEVGHAIQHKQQMPLFRWRGRLVMFAIATEKLGVMALMAIPFVGTLFRVPHPIIALFAVGIGSLLVGVIVQLITLPVETDASFNKALPLLIKGQYIEAGDEKAVKKILRAAAMTYVAATLASILNVWRWFAILRR
ncbi:MAG: Zn-dependent membrane protease YugP [Enterobacterales bacterium]|jgi:Zn-dependent membrane protease YugP